MIDHLSKVNTTDVRKIEGRNGRTRKNIQPPFAHNRISQWLEYKQRKEEKRGSGEIRKSGESLDISKVQLSI